MPVQPIFWDASGNNFVDATGLRDMSNTDSHAKKRAPKMSADDRKQAQMAANRKAQLQWYALGAAITIAVVVAIVLISIYTEGSLGGHG